MDTSPHTRNDFDAKVAAILFRVDAIGHDETAHKMAALREYGIASSDGLMALITDPAADPTLRQSACWLLGRLGEKRAAVALLSVFHRERGLLMHEAAVALGLLRSRRSVAPLIAAVRTSEDADRREMAAYALGCIGDMRAVEPLVEVLSNHSEQARVRGQAAEALQIVSKLIEQARTALARFPHRVSVDRTPPFVDIRTRHKCIANNQSREEDECT